MSLGAPYKKGLQKLVGKKKVSEEMWKAIIGVDNSSDFAEGEKLRGVVSIYQGIKDRWELS